ncbi:hypothetical protein QFC19_003345 [Naganishia cerealis]|uniref:Uncharacterized protein n=1 Tax=Naganishia cerealis TaxID=610337 RepID=A0ACC2W426_9TREE|nr:hypothetical protein QFC19_003345 [Naganishia cerealis]
MEKVESLLRAAAPQLKVNLGERGSTDDKTTPVSARPQMYATMSFRHDLLTEKTAVHSVIQLTVTIDFKRAVPSPLGKIVTFGFFYGMVIKRLALDEAPESMGWIEDHLRPSTFSCPTKEWEDVSSNPITLTMDTRALQESIQSAFDDAVSGAGSRITQTTTTASTMVNGTDSMHSQGPTSGTALTSPQASTTGT